jgi:hypothetical protein
MTDAPSDTMSLMAAAQRLGASRAHAYRLAKEGRFPGAFKLPGHRGYRVHIRVFEAELARLARESGQETDPTSRELIHA